MLTIAPPAAALQLVAALEERGHSAYLVGGCIRDSLLRRTPQDWDIATSARPKEVMDCFGAFRVVETGLQHGTVTVVADKTPYEITTFRVDGPYSDGRRPDSVAFTDSIDADLSRRDFTVNAMAWSPRTGLRDPFGGEADLEKKRIACVGEPRARFGEDALRVLRAVRFSATLDFAIDAATASAIRAGVPALGRVSAERLRAELDKALVGEGVERAFGENADVITCLLPPLGACVGFCHHNQNHHLDVWAHSLASVAAAPADRTLRLAMLLHDVGKPRTFVLGEDGVGRFPGHGHVGGDIANSCLRQLRYDNATRLRVQRLVRYHTENIPPDSPVAVRRWLHILGEEEFRLLLQVKRADIRAHHADVVARGLGQLNQVESLLEQILNQGQCYRLRDLAVGGSDLLELGYPQGQAVGRALNALLEAVIDGRLPNDRDRLLAFAREQLPVSGQPGADRV